MNTPQTNNAHVEPFTWQHLDQQIQTLNAQLFSGLSPVSLALAQLDWAFNLLQTPSAQIQLQQLAWKNTSDWLANSFRPPSSTADSKDSNAKNTDARFADSVWQSQPWNHLVQAQQFSEQWWHQATQLRGMRSHSKDQMQFYANKWLDMTSPSNWLATNPQAIETAIKTNGLSLAKGANHAFHDWWKEHSKQNAAQSTPDMKPGHGLAMTPGEVVSRSHLCELIQYAPSTKTVHAEPVLIIPSCIMKYYILDLSETNSMVKWLVAQGHTVYMVSWRNPDENDALITMDDYVREGVLANIDFVHQAQDEKVHLMGYCLGGTFAAMAAAVLEAHNTNRRATDNTPSRGSCLASLTLLAAETDFTEPGEMGVLIDEAQVRMLEDMMASQGYLSGKQMAGSFQFLHSRELVWSNRAKRWLLGEDDIPNDLMTWNTDLTRLPAVMHSQYLRQCFLNNDLANGHFKIEGQSLLLRNIRVPTFVVGTAKDHVSPWRSVYKVHGLVSGAVTFVLTNGGHNAGIISEPGHHGRHFQISTTKSQEPRLTADDWLIRAPQNEGSWWPQWSDWLVEHGNGRQLSSRTPAHSAKLGKAPGQYVKVCYAD